jgi:sugar phosphate isomerase/epimerase
MRIALPESCFPDADRPDAMRLAAEAGATGVELVLADERAAGLLSDAAALNALRGQADAAGVAIPALALLFNHHTDGLVRESAATATTMAQVRAAIAAAGQLGTPVVMLPFGKLASIGDEKELDFACDRLLELDELAEQAGVTVGVESMLSTNQKLYLIDHAGGGVGVRVYYDVGNVLLRKLDPATELRDLGADRICGVRWRDVSLREGQPADTDMRLGEGEVNFQAVAQALHAIGYDGWVTLETPAEDNAMEAARHNVAFARKMLGL